MSRCAFARHAAAALVLGLLVVAGAAPAAAQTPRDEQWYLDQIGIDRAHAATTGEGVLIGMLSQGVNVDHPELGGRVRQRQTFRQGNVVEPLTGRIHATVNNSETALAGLIVAGGGSGLLGVAPGAEIQPFAHFGNGDRMSLAVRWLVDQGARVINIAGFGAIPARQRDTWDGIRYALAKDVVVIVDAMTVDGTPAVISQGLLVVGGVDRDGKRPEVEERYADRSRINLCAPGIADEFIGLMAAPVAGKTYFPVLANPGNRAAAIVTGAAALVRAKYPDLNAASVINRLLATAKDAGAPGPDPTYGYGLLDVGAAVTADIAPVAKNPLGDPGPRRDQDDSSAGLAILGVIMLVGLVGIGVIVTVLVAVVRTQRRRRAGPLR
ncbi:type VII secretion-associated serine protease mycosin [Micromonospora polyrhachis]|uniref:Subtilisin family serine protease n=1 Tax=Micromonospora polyrhachis TaxID=1282883 RepID=A0A7W7SUG0_9ACTN|nr:S8 family serine peptidase [Micromonospora polyrhachis]MBB4961164.1 subtilisin family serine protease [Micromonospora polyrhachis]